MSFQLLSLLLVLMTDDEEADDTGCIKGFCGVKNVQPPWHIGIVKKSRVVREGNGK